MTETDSINENRTVPGAHGVARFLVEPVEEGSVTIVTPWLIAEAENDFIVRYYLKDLNPGTQYRYRMEFGPEEGRTRQGPMRYFRTLPGKDSSSEMSFLLFSCMGWGQYMDGYGNRKAYEGPDKLLGYPTLEKMQDYTDSQFVIGVGDLVYYDLPSNSVARTLPELRVKWQQQFSFPRLVQLVGSMGSYWLKDDHDFRYDDADLYGNQEPSAELGIRTFREQMPVVPPGETNQPTYRTVRPNAHLQLWMLEGRDYRSPNTMEDGPDKTLWGIEQRDWLKQTLLESDATWKVIVTPSPMVGPDSDRKIDNHTNSRGFRHEGMQFFKWLKDRSLKNVILLTGDRHWQYHSIHPTGISEFSCGSLHREIGVGNPPLPGDPNSTDPEGLVDQRYVTSKQDGGFLRMSVSAESLLRIELIDQEGALQYAYESKPPESEIEESLLLLSPWLIWRDSGTMVFRHLVEQAIGYMDKREAALAKLSTRNDWLERQRHVREKLNQIIGAFPHNSPLNPKITGIVQKEGYRIEKIVFESLPKMYVTGCLFVPDDISGKCPAILYTPGSNVPLSFRADHYQQHYLNLVKKGYVVFAIDPIGQGERRQYYDPVTNDSTVNEFGYPAYQCYLTGVAYAKYYVRDAMKAIDYLQTRPEVDPGRIGMGGLSWGGFQCTMVTAIDTRISAAASAAGCNVGFRRWLQSNGPTQAGQQFPGFLTAGLDHGDFFALMAPRAFLRVSTTRDFKSIQGARETYADYLRAFEALGAPDKVDATEDDGGHGYTPKNHEAVYRFYGKHLNHPGATTYEPVELMTSEDIRVTPTGQVSTSYQSATAFDFNREEAINLVSRLEKSRRSKESHLAAVRRASARMAGITIPSGKNNPVFLGRYQREYYSLEMYVLQENTVYAVPLLLCIPNGYQRGQAIIYLHPDGKAVETGHRDEIEQLVKRGYIVALPDVAGTGETRHTRYHDRALQHVAFLMEQSLVGLQAGDMMMIRQFLQSHQEIEVDKIGAVGIGRLGPALLHAAALDSELEGIVLAETYMSYQSVVMNRHYNMNVSEMVSGALTAYDLPDLIACIAPRRIALIDPKNHMGESTDKSIRDKELSFPISIYSEAQIARHIRVDDTDADRGILVDWALASD